MVNKRKLCVGKSCVKKGEDICPNERPILAHDKQKGTDYEECEGKQDCKMTSDGIVGEKAKRPRDENPEGVVVQSSGRISKKPKWDYDPNSPPKKTGQGKKHKSSGCKRKNKTKREPSFWEPHEKDCFFEALKEHGRDWKGLYARLQRHRGKSVCEKSQEHIRQFYYRAWHKVAKHLTCPEGVDRQALEIFGLICYGELRKRLGIYHIDAAIGQKLNELVFKGLTFLRHRKPGTRKIINYTIKTPRCTILEKLNNLEGIKLHQRRPTTLRMPKEVVVELRPRTNEAWAQVQAISQNPRIRTKADPEKRISSIIDFLNKKWKPLRVKMKENMRITETPEKQLKLHTLQGCALNPWDVSKLKPVKQDLAMQKSLGFEAYMRILENLSSPAVPKPVKRPGGKQQASETKDSKTTESLDSAAVSKPESQAVPNNNTDVKDSINNDKFIGEIAMKLTSLEKLGESEPQIAEHPFASIASSVEGSTKGSITTNDSGTSRATLKSDLSISPEARIKNITKESIDSVKSVNQNSLEDNKDNLKLNESISVDNKENPVIDSVVTSKIEIVRNGLDRNSATGVTVSDLYLMMGMPDKIVLEYDWVPIVEKPDYLNLGDLANMLRRLVDLARSEALNSKSKQDDLCLYCTCGGNKMNTPPNNKRQAKRSVKPSTPKAAKKGREADDCQFKASSVGSTSQCGRSVLSPVRASQSGSSHQSTSSSTSAQAPEPPAVSTPSKDDDYEYPLEEAIEYLLDFPQSQYPNAKITTGSNGHGRYNQVIYSCVPSSMDTFKGKDGVFKVPVSVAPRPSTETSPITVNNIAQKLSPTALMEKINQANKHTDIFLPPRRQKKNRLRRPMVVQRRILPKPFLNQAASTSYTPSASPSTSGSATAIVNSGPLMPMGSGHVIKVMNPADVQSVTLKSVVGPESQLPQVPAIGQTTVMPITTSSSQLQSSHQNQNAGNISQRIPFHQVSNSGPVPVASLPSYIAIQNFSQQSSVAMTPTSITIATMATPEQPSLISQAAMVTGIDMDMAASNGASTHGFETNTDGVMLSIRPSNGTKERASSPCNNSMSALLDISLPAVNEDTTDRLLEMALAGPNNSFNVSALLDSGKCNHSLTKDPAMQVNTSFPTMQQLPSPIQLSPPKNFSTPPDEPWLGGADFNLSNFLSDSPLKKPNGGSSTVASQPSTLTTLTCSNPAVVMTTVPLLSESSRDSVIGRPFDLSVVDGTIQSMMNENSLDHFSKFADLAREIGATSMDSRLRAEQS